MSTPKIKVYRLEKGYNQDSDNDIQSKVNSELLPFIKKPAKPTDAYYLTGIGEQSIQYNGKKINPEPVVYSGEVFKVGTTSEKIECTDWVKNGFYRPRLGYYKVATVNGVQVDKFYELGGFNTNELEIFEEIKNVKSGQESFYNYYTEKDFIYSHPFLFSKNTDDMCYEIVYIDGIGENTGKTYLQIKLFEEKINEVYGSYPAELDQFIIQYYYYDPISKSIQLNNYPIYNHGNYFYNPMLFISEKIELTIEENQEELLYRHSQEIDCNNDWIYYGDGSPIVTYGDKVLGKSECELIYSYRNDQRKIVAKISEDFLKNNSQTGTNKYCLHYNTDSSLILNPVSKPIDLSINDDTKNSQMLQVGENWITATKKIPLVAIKYNDMELTKYSDYELTYTETTIQVEISEDFLSVHTQDELNHYYLYYTDELYVDLVIEMDIQSTSYRKSGLIVYGENWNFETVNSPIVKVKYGKDHLTQDLDYTIEHSGNDFFVRVKKFSSNYPYVLYYELKQKYNLDIDTGLLTFEEVPENFFLYYRPKLQKSSIFISEYTNWSFGHLRENPDIFFGEKDYPGDEAESADTGTPLYSGLKPTFISSGYQIDYMRGTVSFTDGYKTVYRSEATDLLNRGVQQSETFVRACFSYYPEVYGVFRQKMELVSDTDGYVYKPISDKRYLNSLGKRWIMKSDNYQPIFFEGWTDKVKVCSQYLTTAPNYDNLQSKKIVEILATDKQDEINGKLSFILPMIESAFIVFNGFTSGLNQIISFSNENGNIENFSLTSTINSGNEKFYLNGNELIKGEIFKFQSNVKIAIIFLGLSENTETNSKMASFQIVSAEIQQ